MSETRNDTPAKKRKIRPGVLILIVLLVAAGSLLTLHYNYKRTLGSMLIGFYDKQNFAFNEAPHAPDKEYNAPDGIWFMTDLADYRALADEQTDSEAWKSSMEYFSNPDGSLNWDNIETWLQSSDNDVSSTEYDVFARMMLDMTDDDLEKILLLGQIKRSPFKYEVGDTLKHLASIFAITANDHRKEVQPSEYSREDEYVLPEETEIRALAFLQTVIELENMNGKLGVVEISAEEYKYSKPCRCFTFQVTAEGAMSSKLYSPTITVYPRRSGELLDFSIDEIVKYNLMTLAEMKTYYNVPVNELKWVTRFMLNIGDDPKYIELSGNIVQVTRGNCSVAYVADAEFDEDLFYNVKAYNVYEQLEMTTDELISHYLDYDKEYQNYYNWWLYGGKKKIESYRNKIHDLLREQNINMKDATPEQLEEAARQADEQIRENQ